MVKNCQSVQRREFLKKSAMAGMVMVCAPKRSWSASVDARIEVLLDEPIALISPNIYGHFTEHIGGVIYDGVWVGKDSAIRNLGGIRAELVEHMRRLKPGVVRW